MTRSRCALVVLSLAGPMLLTGCFGNKSDIGAIRANATPELDTLYQRPDDVSNAITITLDENGRMFNQDLGRAFLFDRPSRLTREPIPR